MSDKYFLEVVSHHPEFKNRPLKQYHVDGIDTVGAYGNEPFEIKFKNNTWQKVQVKVSLDGTDILTGQKATTDVTKDMWIVNGYGTLSLKAWPETQSGGAAFVFTSADNSVALHTHGDLSHRGIIAVAVYTEGHVEPQTWINNNHYYNYPIYGGSKKTYDSYLYPYKTICRNTSLTRGLGGSENNIGTQSLSAGLSDNSVESNYSASTDKLVSVGAGQYTEQKITYERGLTKPTFTESVQVRYLWWDDLARKLRENNVPLPHPSGFPADREKIMSLGSTPRIGNYSQPSFPREQALYSRF